jgi:hypothetical protein
MTLNRLHGVISQNMILFITIAVKTSNPAYMQLAGVISTSINGQ